MNTIAVANRKGGVGKSTVTVHLAAGLATRGQRVLLVDTDPQGHGGYSLGVASEPGVFNLLVERKPFQEVLRPVDPAHFAVPDAPATGQLFILPSDEKTGVIPMLEKNPFAFLHRLQEVAEHFDTLLIDTAPTATMFDGSVYMAAQAFLYVTECEALSFDGLEKGLAQIGEFTPQRADHNLPRNHILGIVPNKFRRNTDNHAHNLRAMQEAFGELVWTPLPLRTVISEASNYQQAIFAYAPSSPEARLFWRLVDEFEEAIQLWQNAK